MSAPPPEAVPNNPGVTPQANNQVAGSPATSPTKAATGDPRSEFVSTVDQLRKENPKYYRMIVEGWARTMISSIKHHAERMKQIMREQKR